MEELMKKLKELNPEIADEVQAEISKRNEEAKDSRKKKTDTDKLRKAISLIGYNADDVKANKKAHDNLPSCCQHLEFKEEE